MSADLIAKLEAATEADRDLDGEIFCVLYPEWEHDGRGKCAKWDRFGKSLISAPHFTASLDAALPGEDIVQSKRLSYCDPDGDKWQAVHKCDSPAVTVGVGHTEALARRIAALKARSTESAT